MESQQQTMSTLIDDALASLTAPKPVGLPTAPEFLSETQWKVLMSLMDAIIPAVRIQTDKTKDKSNRDTATLYLSPAEYSEAASSLRKAAAPNDISADLIEDYLAERPSDNPLFAQVLKVVLSNVPPNKQRELRIVLSILNTRPGSLILTSYATPLPSLSLADRTNILHNWRLSSLAPLRALFKSLTTLGKLSHLRSSKTFFPLTGFPSLPPAWVATPSYPYTFLTFPPPSPVSEISVDLVIVGSGCGAGVVANRLATHFGPSLSILVLEKGQHFDASHFPMDQTAGLSSMFESGGVVESDDGSISVTAGSVFGGGGTVNWSAALQTQDFVREDWAVEKKLPFFGTEKFQECLDYVCDKMGVTDKITPNHGNRVLLDGAEKCGYKKRKIVPQNCGNSPHDCGYCTLGCFKGEKKGPVNGWFPEAADQGVRFVEGMKVERVLFEQKQKDGKKVACGVKGAWTPKDGRGEQVQVVVRAKKVVVSCGTLWSPIVLMNSGLKNPQIGKNLYLHPVNFVTGAFDEDVRPWEGGSLTTVIGDLENLDGKGHGVKLEATSMLPSLILPFLPWSTSGVDFKLLAAKYRRLNNYISIVRDRDTGSIYRDSVSGQPRVTYTPSDFDRAHIMDGVLALCKILYAAGAREIHPVMTGFQPFIRPANPSDGSQKKFDDWLEKLAKFGNKLLVAPFVSAHQMGTCRMSAKAKDGVVDERGRVWGTEGLYVADTSVFPTASGVNPMVTCMAIADWIARGIVEDLEGAERPATARL
ncbi:hypothetical protein QBC35DRAFT_466686 [Podospora australis]|uniref:Long-chain-alcohol oxidase n=1 Tax=Podospora australis TaxID=1536484 RepID=A0AAN6WM74_9PEZI|nr:hypothetical protein QBC35DRAFT_466686 [Podospora australis]